MYVLRFLSVEDELCIFIASVVPFIESSLNIKNPLDYFCPVCRPCYVALIHCGSSFPQEVGRDGSEQKAP